MCSYLVQIRMDKLTFYWLIATICLIPVLVSSDMVKIKDGKKFVSYLCSSKEAIPPNTELIIDVPILKMPVTKGFCLIENTTNLTITASPDLIANNTHYVSVSCNSPTGFAFFNVTNLTITSINFENCEHEVPNSAIKYIQLEFYQISVSLIFNHCYNLTLYNVLAAKLIGVNLCGSSNITTSSANLSSHQDVEALIYYEDSALTKASLECNIDISSNIFSSQNVKSVLYYLYSVKSVSAYKGYGLSVCLAQQSFQVYANVNIPVRSQKQYTVINVLIVLLNGYTGSKVTYQGYPYDRCTNNYSGGLMPVLFAAAFINQFAAKAKHDSVDQLLIKNTAFTNDLSAGYTSSESGFRGLISVIFASSAPNLAVMENVSICKGSLYPIRSDSIDVLLFAVSYQGYTEEINNGINLIMSNILILDRYYNEYYSQTPGMDLITLGSINVLLTGNNTFNSSGGGAAIKASQSNVTVSGNLTIVDDYLYASNGIVLESNSTLYLKEPLKAVFVNYRANRGSAINAIYDTLCHEVSHVEILPSHKISLDNLTKTDISLHFKNSITSGINTQIYAPTLSFLSKDFTLFNHHLWDAAHSQYASTTVIDAIFKEITDYDKYTSLANGLCVRLASDHNAWTCNYIDRSYHHSKPRLLDNVKVHPGGVAFSTDSTDTKVSYSLTDINYSNKFCFNPIEIRSNSVISHKVYACAIDHFKPKPAYVTVSSGKSDPNNPETLEDLDVFKIHINISCPIGFEMSNRNHCQCECICTKALNLSSYQCDVATNLFSPPPKFWTGFDQDNNTMTIYFSRHCPSLYCNQSMTSLFLDGSLGDLSCHKNRSGILCGQCRENYSAMFGSDACYPHCSNLYLLTLPVYALAGLLLVVVLFALRLTVATGTINGVIFYANILGLVMDIVSEFDGEGLFLIVMRNIIYLLNLKLGFPLCLYDGMSPTAAIGFQFVFPVYLWSLVIGMVILSRCSTKLAKLISKSSVQVLATLFYFSFSSLLRTVIDIFTPTTLQLTVYNHSNNTYESDSQIVWYYSGLEYGRNIHMLYIVLAAIFVILYLLPFTIFTTFSHSLLRFRLVNKLRPFIEAYGGPFKDKWRLWFGLRLWITVALFSASSGLQGFSIDTMMIVYLVVLGAFIFLQAFIQPFKNILTGTLDICYMLNLLITIEFYLLLKGSFVLYYKIFLGLGIFSLFLTLLHHIMSIDIVKQFFANMKPNCFDRNHAQGYAAIGEDEQNDLLFDAERRREI